MKVENKRVFISDLPETASQDIIEAAFGEYGNVTSVEIKERKKADDKNKSLFFAYINLDINDRELQKCFKDFANGKWLEQCVMLQVARESFLDRLKREREENKTNTNATTSESTNYEKVAAPNTTFSDVNLKFNDSGKISNKRRKSLVINETTDGYVENTDSGKISNKRRKSLIINETLDEHEENEKESLPVSDVPIENSTENVNDVNSEDLSYKIKTNKNKLINDVLKIPSVGKKPIATIELHKKEVVNTSEANLKRLESLKNLKRGYQNQKSLIKAALSNVDKKQNKIIFDEETTSKKRSISEENLNNSKQRKLLFNEESDEDDNVNFDVKKQFEGEKGQKLLELQSKYKNDKRFALDSRFLDEDEVNISENVTESNDLSMEEEKKKEFEILSEVLGKKIISKNHIETKTGNNKKTMLRFDPTQPEHSKYEIANEGKKKEKLKTKKNSELINEKKQEEKELPSVSTEVFYKVNENLKGTLQEDKGFSLLNMFGKVNEDVLEDEPEQSNETSLKIGKGRKIEETNPFRYESSDDEDETGNIPNKEDMNDIPIDVVQADRSKANFWSESFFFKPDDYRLQEGFDFIEKMKFDEKTDFSKLRRDLKEIVKAKVRNNQSKKKPFKRKLGGSKKRKMIRMKKALKK